MNAIISLGLLPHRRQCSNQVRKSKILAIDTMFRTWLAKQVRDFIGRGLFDLDHRRPKRRIDAMVTIWREK
jgi:hypothetical protein